VKYEIPPFLPAANILNYRQIERKIRFSSIVKREVWSTKTTNSKKKSAICKTNLISSATSWISKLKIYLKSGIDCSKTSLIEKPWLLPSKNWLRESRIRKTQMRSSSTLPTSKASSTGQKLIRGQETVSNEWLNHLKLIIALISIYYNQPL
jgi:hypothetical protein